MSEAIRIEAAAVQHYNQILPIFNDAFSSKFRAVASRPGLERDFAHDFGILPRDGWEGHFVALDGDRVLGLLLLSYHGQPQISARPTLPLGRLLRKYGLLSPFRALSVEWIFRHPKSKEALYIDSIGVSSHARGQGIGGKLMAYAEEFARSKGFTATTLFVIEENPRARALYERLGYSLVFTRTMSRVGRVMGVSQAHFMKKSLV